MGDERVDLAEPAQHRRHQEAGKSAVARRQRRHVGAFLDGVVERPLVPQHGADQLGGDTARGGGRGRGMERCVHDRSRVPALSH